MTGQREGGNEQTWVMGSQQRRGGQVEWETSIFCLLIQRECSVGTPAAQVNHRPPSLWKATSNGFGSMAG